MRRGGINEQSIFCQTHVTDILREKKQETYAGDLLLHLLVPIFMARLYQLSAG